MRRIFLSVLFSLVLLHCQGFAAPDDPVAELGAFSVFQNVDPAQLLKGDVKTARGPVMDAARNLSVQSCYVVPGSPAKALETLQQWDPSRHPELKIYVHGDLNGAVSPASFGKLASAPDNAAVRALNSNTENRSQELQLSLDEAIRLLPKDFPPGKGALPESVRNFWGKLLAGRAEAFATGGAAAEPDYGFTGKGIQPGGELSALLKQQDKIRRQFAGFIAESGISAGRGSLKKDMYYELINADDDGVLTLGSFSSKPVGNGFQAADVSYYASGGYYVALTLYQMWPVDAGGQPATLVWRGDLISAASLASLHGMEKLASEAAMMKDVAKAVSLLRRDTTGSR